MRDSCEDIESGENSKLLAENSYNIKIKASDASVYNVQTSSDATVAELKAKVLEAMGQQGKFARLLWAGKMLQPDTALLSSFKMPNDSWVHCVLSTIPPQNTASFVQTQSQSEEEEEEDFGGRGFDQLRAAGMSTDEIRAIRATFTAHVDEYMAEMEEKEGEDRLERRLRAEEEWMDAQPDTSEFGVNVRGTRIQQLLLPGRMGRISPRLLMRNSQRDSPGQNVGTARDFAWGFFMGFFLGFIMLFWLWERSVPDRQKMGLLAGVTCQLSLNLLKRQYTSPENEGQS